LARACAASLLTLAAAGFAHAAVPDGQLFGHQASFEYKLVSSFHWYF